MSRMFRYACAIWQRLIQWRLRRMKNDGSVIMLHSINSKSKEFQNVNISKENFLKFIDCCLKKYTFIPSNKIEEENKEIKNPIVLSFDDGFESVYSIAYPVLCKYKIPFTVFITTDFIDKPGYLTKTQVIELSKNELCSIGCHSKSHQMSRFLSKEELTMELIQAKIELENLIEKKVSEYAFPYGSVYAVGNKNLTFARQQKYERVYTTYNSHFNRKNIQKTKCIPRVNINDKVAMRWIDESFS